MANNEGEENDEVTVDKGGGVGFWLQARLLIEKNWKCKLRANKKKLAGEILLPVFYLLLLSLMMKLNPSTEYPEQKEPRSPPVNILNGFRDNVRAVSVVPTGEETSRICDIMTEIMKRKGIPDVEFKFFSSVDSLENAYFNEDNQTYLAVVFSDTSINSFNYTIMSNPANAPITSQKSAGLEVCRSPRQTLNDDLENSGTCPVNGYFYSGFLGLQYLVDQAFLQLSTGSVNYELPEVGMQNYPTLAYDSGIPLVMRAIIPLYSVIPMAQLINSLLILIVTEKENRIKDGFRMIGVSDGAYWLSWFSVYSTIIGVLSVLFTLVMYQTKILYQTNVFLLFLLFFLFGISIITFAFALTPFFHKPKTAGVVGTLIMQLSGMLFMLQTFLNTNVDKYLVPLRLISSVAFTTALDEVTKYERNGGISFSDLTPSGRGSRVLYSFVFLCFDTVFYWFVAIYLDNVIPNEYGAKKHPLFCFSIPFLKRKSTVGYRRTSLDGRYETPEDPNVESVPPSMIRKQAITIRNIFKTYTSLFGSNKVEAIKGISLDIYDGQITAILGKNGAGKSTLFSIITGLVPPTKGKCTVFGMDTSDPNDMDRLRKITGVCLQTNLLFDPLTAEEHLQLYGRLRGLTGEALDNEVATILDELKLTEKAKDASVNLSGGQKRKLSVGIALVGDPKIILLDEPSAGVDPVSRRHLWALLKRKKEGRVILLATHFLDEADFLADRKAIIHNGVLKCHGSSLFLKSKFGVGYHLTVETEGNIPSDQCDALIQRWTPSALNSKKVIGKEIKYCLPNSEVHVFADLFNDLEQLIALDNSAFKSYGVSMTTLEEVFLKISNDAWEEKPVLEDSSVEVEPTTENQECNLVPDLTEIKINIPESLWTLSLLRIRRLIRSPQSVFFMIVMPLALGAGALALMKSQDFIATKELIELDNPKRIYSDEQLRLAFSNNAVNISELEDFIKRKGFEANEYSGQYADLLNPELSNPGTMAALSMSNQNLLNLLINGTFLHSPPLLLNAITQYFLKTTGVNASLFANIKSFPAIKSGFDTASLYAAFIITPSFTLPAVGMVMELVKDREINARNHLRVNGVSFSLYFASIFIAYGLLSIVITISQMGLIFVFALPAYMNPYAITMLTFVLILFIIPCLLFSAWFSYFFDQMESAQSIFSPLSSWMGSIMGMIVAILDAFSYKIGTNTVLMIHGIFSALDVFYIPFGAFYWIQKPYFACTLSNTCDDLGFRDYLEPEVVIMIVCLFVQIPIFTLLVLIADVVKNGGSPWAAVSSFFRRRDVNSSRTHILNGDDCQDGESVSDEDVMDEKTRVANILSGRDQSNSSVVLVQNLKKTYKPNISMKDRCRNKTSEGHKALKGVHFAVDKGEVFGLLGHNGAGKTTAMRIIIAEESPDSGLVRLCGSEISSNLSDAFQKMGYCAQHDPLWENITLKEHLELYAVVRGIPKNTRKRIIHKFLHGLQIQEHANKNAAQLSGGTKRKLSYGISMLGAPRICLLDEPSTGMDPQSKRYLWNTILGTFKESRGAILTTHSMEEAEILCSRIAILAKGSLICIGSPQHLKSKYGSGYTLEIKLKAADGETIDSDEDRYAFVKEHFPDSKVNEIFDDKGIFSLSTASVSSISKTFSLMERLKQQYNIEEYSFSQTTLEQVFLLFAKESEEDEENDSTDCQRESSRS